MTLPSENENFWIFTHHKCASQWQIGYVNEFCELNGLTNAASHRPLSVPPSGIDVLMLTNAHYPLLPATAQRGIHVIRNPLDMVVSAYYSHLATHQVERWPKLRYQRELLKIVSLPKGLELTAEFLMREEFQEGIPGPLLAYQHWDFADTRFPTYRMEDVVVAPSQTLGAELLQHFPGAKLPDPENHSFKKISGREAGVTDDTSHYRDGRPNQWRGVLPPALADKLKQTFDALLRDYYPDSL